MKVFQSIQADCALLGIDSYQLRKKHHLNVQSSIAFLTYISATISSSYYFVCIDKSFEQYIASFYVTTSIIVCFLQYTNLFWQMTKFTDYFLYIEDIVQERLNYPESKDIYNKTIRLTELCHRIINFLFVKILVAAFVLPVFITSFYKYYFTITSPDEAFVLPFFMWFPFDVKNPFGYIAAVAIQCVMLWPNFLLSSCLASIGILAFLLCMATVEDLKNILNIIHKDTRTKKNRLIGVKKLYQFIGLQSITKQYVRNFTNIFQTVTVIVLLWSIGTLCVGLILLEMGINGNNSIMLAVSVLQIEWSMGLAFFPCELGQRITNAFDGVDETINGLNWYLFPIKVKKMLPMIMINAQETVALKCFGSIVCGREAFKNVNNNAFSYFMVLRQFSK